MSEQTISMEMVKQLLAEQAAENAKNLATIIAALKAPTEIEQAQIDKAAVAAETEKAYRKKTAEGALEQMNQKRATQQWCTHTHKETGKTRCVYVMERSGPGYLICQKNQCKIRPGKASPNYKGTDIYNTREFNRIFQSLNIGDGS